MSETEDDKLDHSSLIDRACSFCNKNDISKFSVNKEPEKPDIILHTSQIWDKDNLDKIWMEAEFSSIERPSNIIDKVIRAAKNNAKLIFIVPAKRNKRRDYYANRIDQIIGPPELLSIQMDKNTYKMYKKSEPIKTEEGSIFLRSKETKYEWIYDERKNCVNYKSKNLSFSIFNPENPLTIPDDNILYSADMEDDAFNLHINGEENARKVDDLKKTKYRAVRMPIYPYNIPQHQIRKIINNIEFLVFSKNIAYRRQHPSVNTYRCTIR